MYALAAPAVSLTHSLGPAVLPNAGLQLETAERQKMELLFIKGVCPRTLDLRTSNLDVSSLLILG